MHLQSSVLCNAPWDVLVQIAVEVALSDNVLGPPSDLVPLLLTCKQLYHSLSFDNCRHLYARIFCGLFDSRAARRRMGPEAAYTSSLAFQLRKHLAALKRLRTGNIYSRHLKSDLWTAWTMILENDGKNMAQLEWAGLDLILDGFLHTRLWETRELHNQWPAESTINALVIWLYWSRLDADNLANLTKQQRHDIKQLIRPYVLTALRYPAFHAPDQHFVFPLPNDMKTAVGHALVTPHGYYPLYRDPSLSIERIQHYGRCIIMTPPLIAAGALLLFMTIHEEPFPILDDLPFDRDHANQTGRTYISPTQADIREINAHMSVKLMHRGDWDWRSRLTEEEGKLEDDGVWRKNLRAPSARLDNDWNRLVGCADPWSSMTKGPVYTHGMLTGLWQGQKLNPAIDHYFNLIASTHLPADFSDENPLLIRDPVFMRLREYHCIMPERPVRPGGSSAVYDDGILNAWFPPRIDIREANGKIVVHDKINRRVSQYEEYVEGRPNSHNETKCPTCVQSHTVKEAELIAKVRANAAAAMESSSSTSSSSLPSRADEDAPSMPELDPDQLHDHMNDLLGDEYDIDELVNSVMSSPNYSSDVEDVEEAAQRTKCTGIADIIVVGETLQRHGQAWNHYHYFGRVRPWDGLVAIVRAPDHPPLGVYIFRGYIVGSETLVGSWRLASNNIHAIPLEGPFVMSKVQQA